jgi:hypothetical protein
MLSAQTKTGAFTFVNYPNVRLSMATFILTYYYPYSTR